MKKTLRIVLKINDDEVTVTAASFCVFGFPKGMYHGKRTLKPRINSEVLERALNSVQLKSAKKKK